MGVIGFIPVKAKSSRLPGKNWLPFKGTTLLQHKIRQLKEVNMVDEIIVSTDSPMLLELALAEGATAIRRPPEFADESHPLADFISYVCSITPGEHLLWSCVTSPLFEAGGMTAVIQDYFSGLELGNDSIATVMPFQHYLLDENGPLNFGRGEHHKNSENLPKWYLFTNGATVTPVRKMAIWKDRLGPNPKYFFVNPVEAIDIDYRVDYEIALALQRGLDTGIVAREGRGC